MSASPNLQLPYIDANQNQKSVTHNEALRMLDALVNLGVQSSALKASPAAPGDGQRWIVASGGTGAWAGKDLNLAAWQDGAWSFFPPGPGMIAYDLGQATLIIWSGTAWRPIASLLALLAVTALGIGTAADPGNPLSATLNNALFNALGTAAGGSGDVRVKLNKAAAANTASFLFQDGFSGRAEIGLVGDDGFHFKVSPDGSSFVDALVLAAADGVARFAVSPSAPTPPAGDASTKLATTGFVASALAALVAAAPAALDTLKELADALGDDANFAGTVTAALAARAPLASPNLTGTPTAPTPPLGDSGPRLATTAFVAGAIDPLSVSPAQPTLDYRLTAPDALPPGQFSRLSTGYRTTAAGLLVPVAAGGLRIDHDPVTGACLGALIEEQRTNLLLSSAAPCAGGALAPGWGDIGTLSYATDGTLAPDGSAAQLVSVKGAGDPLAAQVVAYGAVGSTVVLSGRFKAKGAAYVRLGAAFGGTSSFSTASIRLADGTWSSIDTAPASVITRALSGGWWFVAVGFVVPAGTTSVRADIRICKDPATPANVGDGLYAWGLQLEAGAFPTSYIPTTTAQATRAPDGLWVPATGDWFNAGEGTVFVDATVSALPSGSGYQGLLSFDDGPSSGVLGLYYTNNSFRFQSGVPGIGYPEASTGAMPVTPGQRVRVAGSYTAASVSISANGSAPSSSAISGIVAGIVRLRLGAWAGGNAVYDGAVLRAAYIPRALTPAQLQAMTS